MNKRLLLTVDISENVRQFSEITMQKLTRPITYRDVRDKRTHIVCTMGPACSDVNTVVEMIKAGMNVCRFNFSHGTHESHSKTLSVIKEALKLVPDAHIALLLDTKGPEIRTGYLKDHKPIQLEAGKTLKITTDYKFEGTTECIACSYDKLHLSVSIGSIILIADGTLSCEVTSIGEGEIEVKLLNSIKLGEYKNMNLPGVKVDLPVLTESDKDFILNFGIPNNMHFIALSFTQNAQEIKYVRQLLGEKGKYIKIIPKIENMEGLQNYDEILEEADGIMIARGDLGMEMPIEKVCLAQKMMVKKANLAGKPIITATQMLESMVNNPRPTRAEAADVINAVLDGSDCVMLSGETAGGKFPVRCVRLMSKLCFEAENCVSNRDFMYDRIYTQPHPLSVEESIARAAVSISMDIEAKLIMVFTHTGNTTRLVSKYCPKCLILSLSIDDHVVKSSVLNRSVHPLLIETFEGTNKNIEKAMVIAKEHDLVNTGDLVVVVHGTRENQPGSSDLVKVVKMSFRSLVRFNINNKNLTEHCRWHIQISLCLERQPLVYVEPEYERLFRQFREIWAIKTGNNIKLPSLNTIERKISHKIIPSKELLKESSTEEDSTSELEQSDLNELDKLLATEFNIKSLLSKKKKKIKVQEVEESSDTFIDNDLTNINRLPESWLFFIIQNFDNSWSLPTTDLYFGDSVRDTLVRLCTEQVGSDYRPYFLGYCPFTFNKILYESPCDILGKKIFYYRARHIPNLLMNVNKSIIKDYAWCNINELTDRLDEIRYNKIFNTLPLFI